MNSNKLLRDRTRESKGLQMVLVSAVYLRLSAILSTLKNNLYLISNDPKFLKIFNQKATFHYPKNKLLSD